MMKVVRRNQSDKNHGTLSCASDLSLQRTLPKKFLKLSPNNISTGEEV